MIYLNKPSVLKLNLKLKLFCYKLSKNEDWYYLIEFLETIKHLFYQPNTAFMIAANLLQLSSSAKALFGAELDFKNYYRKFSPVVWQLPRIPESLKDQYNKIFQAFCNAYKLEDDIKDLLWKVYSEKS